MILKPAVLAVCVAAAALVAGCTPPARTLVTTAAPGSLTADTPTEASVKSERARTDPAKVIVTRDDITDRAYNAIADIRVVVRRLYLPDPDPTEAEVDERLRESAAALGADAVVLVRYGSSGITMNTWGRLEGQGRAVYFVE